MCLCVQVKFQRKQFLLLHSSETATDLEDYSDTVSWLFEHTLSVLTEQDMPKGQTLFFVK